MKYYMLYNENNEICVYQKEMENIHGCEVSFKEFRRTIFQYLIPHTHPCKVV